MDDIIVDMADLD